MRFSTIFLAIASLGAAYAAVEQPAAGADKLAKRGEFREAVKRAAEPAAQDGWGGNGGWGGAVFADGYCDADNDCPRLCRNQFGSQFNDEGTKCCFNKPQNPFQHLCELFPYPVSSLNIDFGAILMVEKE
ncbi:hypothetical protein GTA08_BOTSDO01730 [Neofusicoccum parvum]|nr:hypothetical protein GTA08_BOTSDO01730 [Neofusicoccum parvum]